MPGKAFVSLAAEKTCPGRVQLIILFHGTCLLTTIILLYDIIFDIVVVAGSLEKPTSNAIALLRFMSRSEVVFNFALLLSI